MERIAFSNAFRQAVRALARFPLVFASGVIGTVAALTLNHLHFMALDARAVAGDLAMTAWLGVPLLFALAEAAESRRWPAWAGYGLQGAGTAALITYHYLLATTPWPVRISRWRANWSSRRPVRCRQQPKPRVSAPRSCRWLPG